MNQLDLQLTGGNNKGNRRKLDYYPTPPEVTIALMDFLLDEEIIQMYEEPVIWECACGNYAMSDVIKKYNYKVIETDIIHGDDFLNTRKECDMIVTNPPFNLSEEFIKHAFGQANIVAFLLKSQYWHAKKRSELFYTFKPSYVLPLTWRPDFLYQERKDGEKSAPTMEVAWSVWVKDKRINKEPTEYLPINKPQKDRINALLY
jgi:hypothetical protein